MRRRMVASGLEDTELVIKDGKSKKTNKSKKVKKTPSKSASQKSSKTPVREVSGKELSELVKMLTEVERIIGVLNRRGISFGDFVRAYYNLSKGGLPQFRICVEGQEEIYYDNTEYEKRLDELKERTKTLAEDQEEESVVAEELHEVERINQINKLLKKQFALDLEDFLLKQTKSVSGEAIATKFQLVHGQDKYDVASLGNICSAIRQIGGKGIDIKRFKGLGEMNADQLWDTTMNPQTRTLLRVALEDAGEADRLFSILMGGDVEKRRNFIREHALEVQRLDI
jgi:DNA gyrase subunit B